MPQPHHHPSQARRSTGQAGAATSCPQASQMLLTPAVRQVPRHAQLLVTSTYKVRCLDPAIRLRQALCLPQPPLTAPKKRLLTCHQPQARPRSLAVVININESGPCWQALKTFTNHQYLLQPVLHSFAASQWLHLMTRVCSFCIAPTLVSMHARGLIGQSGQSLIRQSSQYKLGLPQLASCFDRPAGVNRQFLRWSSKAETCRLFGESKRSPSCISSSLWCRASMQPQRFSGSS